MALVPAVDKHPCSNLFIKPTMSISLFHWPVSLFLQSRVRSVMRGLSDKFRLFRNAVLPQDGDNALQVSSTMPTEDTMTDNCTLTGSMSGKGGNSSLFLWPHRLSRETRRWTRREGIKEGMNTRHNLSPSVSTAVSKCLFLTRRPW